MKITGKRILVKQTLTDEVSKGGIVMAGERQPLPYGVVVSIGPEVENNGWTVGERVLFNEIGSIPLGTLMKDHVLIEPEDILAVLEEGEEI